MSVNNFIPVVSRLEGYDPPDGVNIRPKASDDSREFVVKGDQIAISIQNWNLDDKISSHAFSITKIANEIKKYKIEPTQNPVGTQANLKQVFWTMIDSLNFALGFSSSGLSKKTKDTHHQLEYLKNSVTKLYQVHKGQSIWNRIADYVDIFGWFGTKNAHKRLVSALDSGIKLPSVSE